MRRTSSGPPIPLGQFLRPELPPAALYGLPGEVATALADVTEADPAALLLSFLTMFGNAAGPEPHVQFGGAASQSGRLFTVIVGDAATGRKGTAHEAVENIFADADPGWCSERLMYGLQSPEAMIDRVADGESDDCRLLIVETEFARLLETMARTGTMSSQLRNAYDGRTLAIVRRDRKRSVRASHAHVSVIGHITPAELQPYHHKIRAAGGLESRFLYAYVTRTRQLSPFEVREVPPGLAEQVRAALEHSRGSVLLTTDPISRYLCEARGVQPHSKLPVAAEVRAGWAEIRDRLPEFNEDLGAMGQRSETHVIRLAIIYALADQSPVIRMAHAEAALALWGYCAASAETIFGIPVGSLPPKMNYQRVATLVRALQAHYPRWMPRSYVNDVVFKGNATSAEIGAMLEYLEGRGHIEHRRVGTEGRPRDEYRLTIAAGQEFPRNPVDDRKD